MTQKRVPITGSAAQRGIEGFLALHTAGPRLYVLSVGFQLHTGSLQLRRSFTLVGRPVFIGNPGVPKGTAACAGNSGVREPQIRRETKLSSNAHQGLGQSSPKFPRN